MSGTSNRKGPAVSCEHLVCASCAQPVSEGRCPICRTARADVHRPTSIPPAALVALLALLLVLTTALAARLPG